MTDPTEAGAQQTGDHTNVPPRSPSTEATNKPLLAVMTLVGALIGGIGSETIHYFSAKWLRTEENRSKARDLAVGQTEQTFRQLHALRVKLRADINTYREMYLRADYYGKQERLADRQRNHDHELFYRRMVET